MTSCLRRFGFAGPLVVACLFAVGLDAQTPPAPSTPGQAAGQKPVPKVKPTRGVPIVSVEGKDNYDAYCAVCHGRDGKGNGPAAPAMKAPVPDLTTIAKRNNGQFNARQVEEIIRGTGKTATPAHGVEDMPIWGEVFRSDDRGVATLRIGNLVKYLQSIQEGAASAPK